MTEGQMTNELYWEELVRQKDARIKWLEQEVRRWAAEAVIANDRIEALEKALRAITSHEGYSFDDRPTLSPAACQHLQNRPRRHR